MYENIIHCCRTCCSILFRVFVFPFCLTALFGSSAFAVDDAYLKALEVEAERSAQLNEKPVNKNVNNAAPSTPDLTLDKQELMQFELELKTSRPATYRFYQKLDHQDQTRVLTIYKEDHKMTRASKTVFDLYFEKNK